jgi:hypothetical protein
MHRLAVKAFDNQKGITIFGTIIMPFAFIVADEVPDYLASPSGLVSTHDVKGIIHFRLERSLNTTL